MLESNYIVVINKLKKIFYFPGAFYFRFFAKIQLKIWHPKVIVVTGSSGKTTLLHLIESQLQDKAKYSHFANSSYGIPFNILGLSRKKLTLDEWLYLFILAPFKAFKKAPIEKIYLVEADCDRPYEGKFLANLLKPEVTLWTGIGRTHAVNFDKSVRSANRHSGKQSPAPYGTGRSESRIPTDPRDSGQARMTPGHFPPVEDAIAYEFGFYLETTAKLAIVNADSRLIKEQLKRSKLQVKSVTQRNTDYYKVFKDHTEFKINGKTYSINALLPKEASLSIQMTLILLDYLKIKPDYSFLKFSLPPGRCSIFKGIKNTTIIDSSYNATPEGVKPILGMFNDYPSDNKWLVLGDMIELGHDEQEEHEKLAYIINTMKLDKIVLVGPRLSKYTYPKLNDNTYTYSSSQAKRSREVNNITMEQWNNQPIGNSSRQARTIMNRAIPKSVEKFIMPKNALEYLVKNLQGGEVILFKGARFLEGIIERLLENKSDVDKLCRREKIWQERRKKWGL